MTLFEAAGEEIEGDLYKSIGINPSETVGEVLLNPFIIPEIALQIVEWVQSTSADDITTASVTQRAVDVYNRLIERADHPTDVDELKALLPWVKRQIEKSLGSK